MTNFKMEFYVPPNGVVVTYHCRTEQNYVLVKAFLQNLVGGPCSPEETDRTYPTFIISRPNSRKRRCSAFSGH
jgi:hypothetical protein